MSKTLCRSPKHRNTLNSAIPHKYRNTCGTADCTTLNSAAVPQVCCTCGTADCGIASCNTADTIPSTAQYCRRNTAVPSPSTEILGSLESCQILPRNQSPAIKHPKSKLSQAPYTQTCVPPPDPSVPFRASQSWRERWFRIWELGFRVRIRASQSWRERR